MTNAECYAFCRDKRKAEPDEEKRAALVDVYGFVRECGVSKASVKQFIDHQIFTAPRKGHGQARADVYTLSLMGQQRQLQRDKMGRYSNEGR